jgi:hypothetical protein
VGGEEATTRLELWWGGSDLDTDSDERSREGEGHLRRAPKGEWGWEGKKGAAAVGCTPF